MKSTTPHGWKPGPRVMSSQQQQRQPTGKENAREWKKTRRHHAVALGGTDHWHEGGGWLHHEKRTHSEELLTQDPCSMETDRRP